MIRAIAQHRAQLRAASLAALLVASLCSSAYAEFYPDRPVYDYEKRAADCSKLRTADTVRSRCGAADGPVFDSFVNTPSYGDERAFVDARLGTRMERGAYANVLDVGKPDGRVVVVRLYVNNGANEALGPRSTAHGARVQIKLPTASGRALRVVGLISADDATPSPVADTVDFVADKEFKLEYVPGASLLYTDATYARDGQPLGASVVANGALISNTGVPGEFEAGFDKDAQVQIRLRVVASRGGSVSNAAVIALAALGGLTLVGGAWMLVNRRRRAGEPVVGLVVGAAAVIVSLAATILIVARETDTAVAGYVLALVGMVIAVVQLVRSP